jgi:hypothetical protein
MSDTVFTPDERGELPDPVTRRPGHRTESIVLADEAEYSLSGKRQDGATEISSKIGHPFEGTYEVSFRDDEARMRYRVKKNDIAATAWDISTNVLTVTVADNHRLRTGQWITLDTFPSASTFPAAGKNTALQITAINDTTFTAALTASDDSATEAFNVSKSDVRMEPGEGENIFAGVLADNEDINLGPLRAGRYRMLSPGTGTHDAWFVSDGTTIDLEVSQTGTGTIEPSDSYDDADSATLQALWVSSGDLVVTNGAGVSTTIRVDYYPDEFDDADVDGKMCFFEKDGDLVIKNRTGAAQTCAIQGIRANVAGRISSSASQLPAEHPEA